MAHAFIWTKQEGMVDLNTRIANDCACFARVAYAINGRGLIVGFGDVGAEHAAFILTPL